MDGKFSPKGNGDGLKPQGHKRCAPSAGPAERAGAENMLTQTLGRLFAQGSIDEITANEAVQEIYLGKGHHGH